MTSTTITVASGEYVDTGDREIFVNKQRLITLHPVMTSRAWEASGCAPLVVAGPMLAAVRRRLDQLNRMRATA